MTVTFEATSVEIIEINDAGTYVETVIPSSVDCVFNVAVDLNAIYGDKYGLESMNMPYNRSTVGTAQVGTAQVGTAASADYAAASADYAAASADYAAVSADYAPLVGTAQVGTAQVGTAQVGTAASADYAAASADYADASTDYAAASADYAPLVGTAQVGTAQVGTAQVGTAASTDYEAASADYVATSIDYAADISSQYQFSVDDFTDSGKAALRTRIEPLLKTQNVLKSSSSGSGATHGDAKTLQYQMEEQLKNLFDNMTLGEENTRIGSGLVRIVDSKVTDFLTSDGFDNMVTKTMLNHQLAQLLEVSSRDASRYIAKGAEAFTPYKHVLNLTPGDRLSCRIIVKARSATHGTEPYVNTQVWRIDFEQSDVEDHYQIYKIASEDINTQQIAIDETHPHVFPDEQSPSYDLSGGNGWIFTKTSVGGEIGSENINWYFNTQDSTQINTLADYTGIYVVVKLVDTQSLPFLNVYTKPTLISDETNWYHSKRTYVFPNPHNVIAGEEVVMYIGTDQPVDNGLFPDLNHVKLVFDDSSSNGEADLTQQLLTVSFSTSTSDANVDLIAKAFYVGCNGAYEEYTLVSD